MMKRSFNCAVYFIEEDDDVMNVYNALQSSGASISVHSSFLEFTNYLAFKHVLHDRQVPHE